MKVDKYEVSLNVKSKGHKVSQYVVRRFIESKSSEDLFKKILKLIKTIEKDETVISVDLNSCAVTRVL